MASSTILFTDIVGFSREAMPRQVELASELQTVTRQVVSKWLLPSVGSPDLVALPTGDGVALIFLDRERKSWQFEDVVRTAALLTRWAGRKGIQLCVGVHNGPVESLLDVNGRPNVCGDAINVAQRVLSAADAGQVLFSSDVVHQEIGGTRRLELEVEGEHLVLETGSEVTVYAKHDRVLQVVPASLRAELSGRAEPGWSPAEPTSASVLPVSLTDLPKSIDSFAPDLGAAHSVALVQLTGENLLVALERGGFSFSDSLRRLWVFLPDPVAMTGAEVEPPLRQLSQLVDCLERWTKRLKEEKRDRPNADVSLRVFREPPFLGGSYLNWDEPGGRVHVSPYVWGLAAKDCPGFDLVWRGGSRHPVYDRYVRGLDALRRLATEVEL